MRLVIKSGGKVIDTLGAGLTLSPGAAGIRVNTKGSKTDGKLTVALDGFIEFDGFIWNEITVTPSAEVQIDEIYFETPFNKEFAKVFNISYDSLFEPQPVAIPDEGLETIGRMEVVRGKRDVWSHPVICDGRLYVRYHDKLYCYDVRRQAAK